MDADQVIILQVEKAHFVSSCFFPVRPCANGHVFAKEGLSKDSQLVNKSVGQLVS